MDAARAAGHSFPAHNWFFRRPWAEPPDKDKRGPVARASLGLNSKSANTEILNEAIAALKRHWGLA
jgi:hypothetical protein